MSESTRSAQVVVAVEPYLLRTTLYAALVADGRLDAHLCPFDADPVACARELNVRMLVVSEKVAANDMCVATLSSTGTQLTLSYGGDRHNLAYAGIEALVTQLVHHMALLGLDEAAS